LERYFALPGPEAPEHLGEILDVDAPAGRAVEAPDGVGAGLLRRPGSGAEVVDVVPGPQPRLGHVDPDRPREPHDGELVGGQIRVRPVGSLEDPVPVPPVGGDDEPVAPTAHGELQRHARQGGAVRAGGRR